MTLLVIAPCWLLSIYIVAKLASDYGNGFLFRNRPHFDNTRLIWPSMTVDLSSWSNRRGTPMLEALQTLSGRPIVRVDLSHNKLTRHDMVELAKCTRLIAIGLRDSKLTNELLEFVKMESMVELDLRDNPAVDHLPRNLGDGTSSPRPVRLLLDGTNITDESLPRIGKLVHLNFLSMAGTRVSNSGIEHLTNLGHLAAVDLSQTSVSDAGVTHLSRIKSLQAIVLRQTNVTADSIFDLIKNLPRLEYLSIPRAAKSDKLTEAVRVRSIVLDLADW